MIERHFGIEASPLDEDADRPGNAVTFTVAVICGFIIGILAAPFVYGM